MAEDLVLSLRVLSWSHAIWLLALQQRHLSAIEQVWSCRPQMQGERPQPWPVARRHAERGKLRRRWMREADHG